MLALIYGIMGLRRRIIILPGALAFLPDLYGKYLQLQERSKGLYAGLDHCRVFHDILRRFMYIEAVKNTRACYPEEGG
jgi:hypothetical protein